MGAPSPWSVGQNATLTAATVAAIVAIVWLSQRVPRKRRHARWKQALTAVIVVIWVAFVSPLATLAEHYLLTAHLVQQLLLMGVVSPLLLVATTSTGRESAPVPRARWTQRAVRAVAHPVVALLAVNVVYFAWHATPLFDFSLANAPVYALLSLATLATSVAFWWPIVEPGGRSQMSGPAKLGYILLATIPQTFAGLTYAMSHHVLSAIYAAAPRVTGIDALTDQQVAGASLALLSKIALFTAFSVIFLRLFSDEDAPDNRDDDEGDGESGDDPGPVPTSGVPAWVESTRHADEPAAAPRLPVSTR